MLTSLSRGSYLHTFIKSLIYFIYENYKIPLQDVFILWQYLNKQHIIRKPLYSKGLVELENEVTQISENV